MAIERKSMSAATRRQVMERDKHACQKCGKQKHLDLHHIHPVAQEQDDTHENLITLCKYCHNEWEHIVYVKTDKVDFENWLGIPPALELIALFSQEQYWRDDISARDARGGIIQMFQFLKECRQGDEE